MARSDARCQLLAMQHRRGEFAKRHETPADAAPSLEQDQQVTGQDGDRQENRYREEEPERILLLRLGKR